MSGRPFETGSDAPDRRLRRPAEGWVTVILTALLVLILAWAIDDPAWVNGRGALTDSLPLCALAGLAFGMVGPKVGWGRWTTHGIGAVFAGLLIPVLAGWAIRPGSQFAEAFHATAEGTANAYLDIAWRGLPYTQQEVHYVLVLGVIVWGTAQFMGYAVYGHRQALNGVVMAGIVLLANMALTSREQIGLLVAFTVLSLFLLIEMHAFDERAVWLRRRIGDPSAIASLYLRGGAAFIVVATVASLVLTTRAASAPLAGAWAGVDNQLIQYGQELGRMFPVGPDVRGGGGVSFGSSARIVPRWHTDQGVAFQATVPADMGLVRWRAATYDTFALMAWMQTEVTSYPVTGGDPLLAGTPEEPAAEFTTEDQVTVRPDGYHDTLLLAPGAPVSVDRAANVLLNGEGGWFSGVDLPGGQDPYTATAAVLRLDDEQGITGNRLIAAPEEYPEEISAAYTDVPKGALGPDATELLQTVLAMAPGRDPYVLAKTIEDYLRSDAFTYETNLVGVACDDGSAVECFARTTKGYCLHYASTMAMLLRAANPANPIPTRLVQGFLPGERHGETEIVRNSAAHAWVEVYFPGYGWIPFDPTGGGRGIPSAIPLGPAVLPSAAPSAGASGSTGRDELPSRQPGGASGTNRGGPNDPNAPADRSLLIVLTALLGLLVLGIAIAAWVRGPRGEVSPDAAWQTTSRAASRFGFGRRPTQTVYEYAAALGELVPVARADLQTVAEAKVETTYARAELGGDRLAAVRTATRRLRVSLLRLAFRRGRGRGRGRR